MATFLIPNEPSEFFLKLVDSETIGYFKGDIRKAGAAVAQAAMRKGYEFGLKDGRAQGFTVAALLVAGIWCVRKVLKKEDKNKADE